MDSNRTSKLEKNDRLHNFLSPYGNPHANAVSGPLVISRGKGVYVYDEDGRKYIEGVSALWYATLGFSESRLVDAAFGQLKKLPCYHAFGNKISDVCLELTDRLTELTPEGLNHVFYGSSGSDANDTAMKLVRYYNNALGRPNKKKIIAREAAYHGTSLATASLTGVPRNHWGFDLPIEGIVRAKCPNYYRDGLPGESEEAYTSRILKDLEQQIESEGPETIAAFIAEPVMGVGGVIVPPKGYFSGVQKLLKKYDILFIADEVISGFGRLGFMFGVNAFEIQPDIMAIAKAFSAGYQPISALVISDEINEVVAKKSAELGTLGHGYTYSAHPVPAAVALETLNIYRDLDILKVVKKASHTFWETMAPLREFSVIGELRGMGLIAGIELVADRKTKEKFPVARAVGKIFETHCLNAGLIVRAIGDTIAVAPPFIISDDELRTMSNCLINAARLTELDLKK